MRERLRNHINDHCIMRVPDGSREMPAKDRGWYTWQFYLRSAVLNPSFLRYIADDFWSRPHFLRAPYQLATVEQAGVPLLTALLLHERGARRNAFTIRKQYKSYGIGNIIEGQSDGSPVVFVDDLTSPQHDTFWHAARVIKRHGLSLYPAAFVLVRKQRRTESSLIPTSWGPIDVNSVFDLDDFTMQYNEYHSVSDGRDKICPPPQECCEAESAK